MAHTELHRLQEEGLPAIVNTVGPILANSELHRLKGLQDILSRASAAPQGFANEAEKEKAEQESFLRDLGSGPRNAEEQAVIEGQSTEFAPARLVNFRRQRAQDIREEAKRPKISLRQLVAMGERLKGLPQAISVPLLQRLAGIEQPDKAQQAGRVAGAQAEAREQVKLKYAQRHNLDPSIMRTIGTEEFRPTIEAAVQKGLDRKEAGVYFDLHQKELNFQQRLTAFEERKRQFGIREKRLGGGVEELVRRATGDAGGDPESVVGGQEEAEPARALNARQRFRANLESESELP